MAGRLAETEIAELARVFAPTPALVSLLGQAGFPVDRIPQPYGVDGSEYWSLMNDRIGAGLIPDGRRQVIDFALSRFPANPVFLAAARPAVRKVLVVSASPPDRPAVRAARELRAIKAALAGADTVVDYLPAASIADLADAVLDGGDAATTVLHMCCHGEAGFLVFEDHDGNGHPVPIADIVETFRVVTARADEKLRAIVIAACQSADAADALLQFARTVIAHRGDLDDKDAEGFAGHFYQTLRNNDDTAEAASIAAQLTTVDRHGQPWLRDGLVVREADHPGTDR
jgi:hypothetical protein